MFLESDVELMVRGLEKEGFEEVPSRKVSRRIFRFNGRQDVWIQRQSSGYRVIFYDSLSREVCAATQFAVQMMNKGAEHANSIS